MCFKTKKKRIITFVLHNARISNSEGDDELRTEFRNKNRICLIFIFRQLLLLILYAKVERFRYKRQTV